MSDRARINIIGRLTKQPEIRTNSNGKQYVTFSVAINYYDATKKQQDTMYMNCMAGERHTKYLQGAEAGDKIDVIGRLTPNVYTDKQGVQHAGYSIMVDDIDITHKAAGSVPAGQQRPQAPAGQQQYQQSRYQSQQAPAPQQQSNYYEQNPFGSQGQGQNNGFRPATYTY